MGVDDNASGAVDDARTAAARRRRGFAPSKDRCRVRRSCRTAAVPCLPSIACANGRTAASWSAVRCHRSARPRRRRIVARAVARRGAERERDDDRVASGFAHLVFAATPAGRSPRARLGAAGRRRAAFTDTGVHVQSTWERRDPAQTGVASVRRLHRARPHRAGDADVSSWTASTSDPVSDLIDAGAGTARRWALGARVAPGGAAASDRRRRRRRRSRCASRRPGSRRSASWSTACRRVCGRCTPGSGADVRHLTTFAAYANEHVTSGA